MSDQVAVATARAASKPRSDTIDGLKYIAAAGIVMHHVASGAGTPLGTFLGAAPLWSLFFFFAVSGYFHGQLGTRGWKWLGKRVVRLGVPYVIWSVFYLAWRNQQVLHGAPLALPKLTDIVFLAGAHGILWSLALLIYIAIAVELTVKSAALRRLALLVAAGVTLWIYWLPSFDAIQYDVNANFILVSRYAFAYLGGMEIRSWGGYRGIPDWMLKLAAIGSIVGVGLLRLGVLPLALPVQATLDTLLWTLAALVILWGAATGMQWYGARRLAWGRDYLLGVYVIHVFWLSLFIPRVPPTSLPDWLWIGVGWAFCLGAATLTVALLRTNKVTRIATA